MIPAYTRKRLAEVQRNLEVRQRLRAAAGSAIAAARSANHGKDVLWYRIQRLEDQRLLHPDPYARPPVMGVMRYQWPQETT